MTEAKKRTSRVKRGKRPETKPYKSLEKLEVVYVPIDAISPNPYNPNRQSEHDFTLLCKSIAADGFCVEESTPVLCADLVWRPAGELRVGQELVAFDEDPPEVEHKHGRRFRTAAVTDNALFEDELYEVRTESGDVVRCNARHPWLVRRNTLAVKVTWVETADLRPTDVLLKLFEPWEVDRTYEGGWLAGFLDGEGCISAETTHNGSAMPVRLSVTQKPGAKALRMVGEMQRRCPSLEVSTVEWSKTHPERNWQDNVRVRVNDMASVMAILGSVRPQRLLDNAGRFWEERAICTRGSGQAIASVSKVGRGRLASLSTSTRTYIAAGFAVHNTQPVIVNRESKQIVDGEHRWRACRALQFDEIPIVLTDMTPEQMRISTLRHNRARGSENADLVIELFKELSELGATDVAVDELMLDPVELERLTQLDGDELARVDLGYDQSALGPDGQGLTDQDKATNVDTRSDERRARERKLAEVKEQEEARMGASDASVYRLQLIYTGEQAALVQRVLKRLQQADDVEPVPAAVRRLCAWAADRPELGDAT
jgi:ParB-like chromosome segregation protein Spo0J